MDNVYWKTIDGKILDVDLMTESHIRNTLKMLITKYGLGASKKEVNEVKMRYLDSFISKSVFGYNSVFNKKYEE